MHPVKRNRIGLVAPGMPLIPSTSHFKKPTTVTTEDILFTGPINFMCEKCRISTRRYASIGSWHLCGSPENFYLLEILSTNDLLYERLLTATSSRNPTFIATLLRNSNSTPNRLVATTKRHDDPELLQSTQVRWERLNGRPGHHQFSPVTRGIGDAANR